MKNSLKRWKINPAIRTCFIVALIVFLSCKEYSGIKVNKNSREIALSENDFVSVPDQDKPWVYYWWLKGNVTKDLITRDLEEMHKKGIGGFLLFDSRGYWDDYYGKTGHIPVPLNIKHEFMSSGWREMVRYTMQEANRLGLKMSMNVANTGGSLRGPWNMKDDGPKQLIWTTSPVAGPLKIEVQLEIPLNKKYFRDVALMAVQVKYPVKQQEQNLEFDLNKEWKTSAAPGNETLTALKTIDLESKIKDGKLVWNVPEGNWQILRFGFHIIGEEGSVDILSPESVTKYFHLMGSEILKDAGPLASTTLTHFYNVSWEGGQPNWTVDFERYFKKFRGYDIRKYLPLLIGISDEDTLVNERFMQDYLRTVSDCFKHNCYETIGKLCHSSGVQWHSEDGGPWPRNAPMFKEADQLTFWGENDMPQGEFWCSDLKDLSTKSNIRYAAMAGHIYGHPLVAVEAFTHMGLHWTKYPAYLKPFADINLIDGANFFIWHTFTASPLEIGKPGYEYFAGTHLNPNVTWWDKSEGFLNYLGRCQSLLRKGDFVADVCCYVSDKNYVTWGRGEKWNPKSTLKLPAGYTYDLLSSEILASQLTVKDGKLWLPNGMNYKMLVVDLEEPVIQPGVLKQIIKLVKQGATVVVGATKPKRSPGMEGYPESTDEISRLSDELWSNTGEKMTVRSLGKGKIYSEGTMDEILKEAGISNDFDGPFEYIHRTGRNADIYFISGEGKAECSFRVKGKKPEIWDPVSGKTCEAAFYRTTEDGRTAVWIELPKNGSTFVIFRNDADERHFFSIDGPSLPKLVRKDENSGGFVFWQNGDYAVKASNNKTEKVAVNLASPVEVQGKWTVTFKPETGTHEWTATFDKLTLWNENTNPDIKYFSGTATYVNSFTLNEEQAHDFARLQLGEVHDISRVWVNGQDLGIVWTAPWSVDLKGVLKAGTNELKIEVTNCWANRLIGDAGLPENQWTTKTNVRRIPDRSVYKEAHQALSALDKLMPSGLIGPVRVEFGQEQKITF